MSGKFEITDDIMPLILLYSKVTIALNAARVMKVLGGVGGFLVRSMNRTEEYLIRFAATTLMVNAAVVYDRNRSALNLRKLITDNQTIPTKEKTILIQDVDRLYGRHKQIIDHIEEYRNNLVAHTSKGINSVQKFSDIPQGDVADMQKYLSEVADLIESISIFPSKEVTRERVIDYTQIREDLKP